MKNHAKAVGLLSLFFFVSASLAQTAKAPIPAKLAQLVEANIKSTHAYECLDAKKLGEDIRAKYWNTGSLSDEELKKLVDLQKEMMAEPSETIAAWARGEQSSFNEAKYIGGILGTKLSVANPALPVNTWEAWLKEKAPKASALQVKSLASLQQMMGDMYRDGDVLQDLFRVYVKLGLPVHLGQVGIAAKTDAEFMAFAEDISAKMGPSPYDETPRILKMDLRKMYNWGHRYTGERDKIALAKQLLAEPALKAAILSAQQSPPLKIAIIGHSYTMEVHWSTPGSFVPVVTEMMKAANPKTQFKYFQQGGMDAVTAQQKFYQEALSWHPDLVLFVVLNEGAANRQALKTMVDGFSAAGTKCVMFDSLWPADWDLAPKKTDPVLSSTKLNIIEVKALLMASPQKDQFLCLDGIHMQEPWHLLMAREWFKYLAGVRKDELAAKP